MEYKIYVGSILKIKKGFLKGEFKLLYCGMPNEQTFVLTPFIQIGYHGFSPSIYYSTHSQIIQVHNKDFDVIKVTPEYIILAD
ncbi:MAG: hypothetical protein KJN84_17715 [Bacteroidia bacterium]|nr:hypothetical protein [Bacteroidia bacterium]